VRDLANKLLDVLASHTELAPPAISDGAALVDKPPPEDEPWIAEAMRKRQSAEQNLAQRNFREAAIDAVEGQELLLRVTPRAAIALYADLALALGQSRLGEKKDAQAREAFALTYRLDPRRTLDELHYLPEVVQTYEAAKHATPGTGTILVRGAGRVWIDGEELGAAPGEFKASYGRHVVWLTGLLREVGGKEVTVTPSRPGDATIMDGPLTRPQKVVRFRNALSRAQDPAARASAMVALATFVNVHDAVLLAQVNGKITYQIWRDREPGFDAIKEVGNESPSAILKPLLPPPAPATIDVSVRPFVRPPMVVATRWYQHRGVQIGVLATVVAAIVGGYLWAQYQEPPRPWDHRIEIGTVTTR
jgi:predicted regulator of Ras-like GTPase activity (Roadblock/LC7/MglB family)